MSLDKPALRKEMAKRRAKAHGNVDPNPALRALADHLAGTEAPVSFYWPIRTEIDPRPVMERLCDEGTDVCLPVTKGHDALSFRRWEPSVAMDTDGFGVAVPKDTETLVPSTLVIPMLGFDAACQRLGYGAGHYDRTLDALKQCGPVRSIGFAYAVQRLDEALPAEPTDQPLDMIVTEEGTVFPL